MATGDVYEATAAGTSDLYFVDTGLYDTPGYGSIYVLDSERPAVIETGTGYRPELIVDAVERVGIDAADLAVIAVTHVHLDHAGGAGYLLEEFPNADVYLHEAGTRFLADPAKIWEGTKAVVGDRIEYYAEPKPIPEDRLVALDEGEVVDLGDHELRVHHAPGHAFHQAAFYDPENDGVFTADAAGINSPTVGGLRQTSPPPGFDLEGCLDDVELLQDLDPAALYYSHFGDYETGDLLAEYADLLESWVERVERKRAELGDDAVAEFFADEAEGSDAWSAQHARQEERMNVQGVLHYLDER
ncbi:MBL fold metallo-hydrolase [Halobacteriales archaeon SW_10_66_29]|nr:MAG: MBL fold metallo-hydrolase [Halobacteriales archaeon SW_10_66_29]